MQAAFVADACGLVTDSDLLVSDSVCDHGKARGSAMLVAVAVCGPQ